MTAPFVAKPKGEFRTVLMIVAVCGLAAALATLWLNFKKSNLLLGCIIEFKNQFIPRETRLLPQDPSKSVHSYNSTTDVIITITNPTMTTCKDATITVAMQRRDGSAMIIVGQLIDVADRKEGVIFLDEGDGAIRPVAFKPVGTDSTFCYAYVVKQLDSGGDGASIKLDFRFPDGNVPVYCVVSVRSKTGHYADTSATYSPSKP